MIIVRLINTKLINIIAMVIMAVIIYPLTAGARPLPEYQIKAAFVTRFIKYITWPAECDLGNGKIQLCIIGQNPFGKATDMIDGTAIGDNIVTARHIKSLDALKLCRIVFISPSDDTDLDKVLNAIDKPGVLTISDTAGFARKGVIINFYTDKGKVRFEINVDAARRSNLQISSKLLRLASIVHDL